MLIDQESQTSVEGDLAAAPDLLAECRDLRRIAAVFCGCAWPLWLHPYNGEWYLGSPDRAQISCGNGKLPALNDEARAEIDRCVMEASE